MSKVGESENDPQDNDLHRHTLISKIWLNGPTEFTESSTVISEYTDC